LLTHRAAVAAIGLPALGALVLAPERLFTILVTLVIAVGAAEFIRAIPSRPAPASIIASGAFAALLAVSLRTMYVPAWTLLGLVAVTAFAATILAWPDPSQVTATGAWWLGGVLYTGVLGAHWLLLRNLPGGQSWILLVLAVTFATDTGAYAVGKLFGHHILWRSISPSKTWEGFGGGMVVGGATVCAVVALLSGASRPWPWVAFLAVLLPFAGIAGDLLESAIKRRMGVKDMSRLLPGHGGLLDRLDSLLLVGPCLYWILWLTR
jgi:phosphatidate cytidylyltransferase